MNKTMNTHHNAYYNEDYHALYFSPGRVNMIGEHTDYSGGYVLPISISLGIYASVSKRQDKEIYVVSEDFKALGKMKAVHNASYSKKRSFMNYIEGIVSVLKETHGLSIERGLNIVLKSTLPKSAGLSSSAALEVLFLTLFNDYYRLGLDQVEVARLAKRVENDYIGVACGIMDQFVIAKGQKNHALLLDTETLEYTALPLDLSQVQLVLMNTNKARDLVDSEYNARFKAVDAAKLFFTKPLGKLSIDALEAKKDAIDGLTYKRLTHVVSENARTLEAKEALFKKQYHRLGKLMHASHVSLRDDFEVSCEELDYLVDYHMKEGALGARMTGAGFGGTMIALYEKHEALNFDALKDAYQKKFNLALDIYFAEGADGAKRLEGEL